jgi:hypothetical protein
LYGGAEATSFERMMSDLAEWFIDYREMPWNIGAPAIEATPPQVYSY